MTEKNDPVTQLAEMVQASLRAYEEVRPLVEEIRSKIHDLPERKLPQLLDMLADLFDRAGDHATAAEARERAEAVRKRIGE
jgi:hypothetical protein